MKHLKTFNESTYQWPSGNIEKYEKDVFPIIDMVNDILLELTDEKYDLPKERFRVKVEAIGPIHKYTDKLGIVIRIRRDDGFILKDIEEVVNRIDSYLESEGYHKSGRVSFDGYDYGMIYRYTN